MVVGTELSVRCLCPADEPIKILFLMCVCIVHACKCVWLISLRFCPLIIFLLTHCDWPYVCPPPLRVSFLAVDRLIFLFQWNMPANKLLTRQREGLGHRLAMRGSRECLTTMLVNFQGESLISRMPLGRLGFRTPRQRPMRLSSASDSGPV